MPKRTLQQIEESLRSKLAEVLAEAGSKDLDNDGIPDDAERSFLLPGSSWGGTRDDPVHQIAPPFPGAGGGGRGSGSSPGGGGGRPKVWRGPEGQTIVPKAVQRPRVTPADARAAAAERKRAQELLTGQTPKEGPKVWRRGEESSSLSAQTPKEKLAAQAQAQAKATGEPVVTLEPGSFASRILDKMFPEKLSDIAKQRIEPKITEPKEPAIRADQPGRAGKKTEPTLEPTGSQKELRTELKGKEKDSEIEKNARNARYWRNTLGAAGLTSTAAVGYGLKKAYDLAKEKAKEYFPPTDQPQEPSWTPTPDDLLNYDTKNESDESSRMTYNKDQYISWAKSYAEKYGVPLPLALHAMYNETGWLRDPSKMATATSPTGARGVMQIQPQWAEKGYGIKIKDLTDPEKNIEAGVRGLAKYLKQFGTPENALAAYNAGPGGASKFIQTGNIKFLKPETRKYIMNYKDDVIHNLQKFYPKDKKKIAQVANDILGTAVGAKVAQAEVVPEIVPKKDDNFDNFINQQEKENQRRKDDINNSERILKKITSNRSANNKLVDKKSAGNKPGSKPYEPWEPDFPKSEPTTTRTKTLKISKDQAQNLPPVDVFGHIFPSIDWNKQGGVGGISTKPYTLPDGTVITDKRALQNIRSLQQQTKSSTADKSSDNKASSVTPANDIQAAPVVPAASAPEKRLSKTATRALSDFEKSFAAARAEKGPGREFNWTNPKTGKTGAYSTALKGEKSATNDTEDLAVKNADTIDQSNIIQQMQKLKVTPQLESINTKSDLEQILILAGRK